jgi:Family of unknown function (DUF5317)
MLCRARRSFSVRQFLRITAIWILLLPVVLGLLGAASNQLVLIANHGKFPVMYNAAITARALALFPDGQLDEVHCLMTSETHLNFLADIFNLHTAIFSIGDFFLMLGDWMWAFCPFIWLFEVCRRLHDRALQAGREVRN